MTVYLLPKEPIFPPVEEAEEDGLIAIGGDLSVERLVEAYASGIFPWFMEEDEVYWYSPNPRLVLYPDKFRKSESLTRILRSGWFQVRFDTRFDEVIKACSSIERPGEHGTWISEEFINAYTELHHLGVAHSVETYFQGELVGGLYGISLGSAFFGESMFYKKANASKVAFAFLVEYCRRLQFKFIDCQVESDHLIKLGATPIPRANYLMLLEEALSTPTKNKYWKNDLTD